MWTTSCETSYGPEMIHESNRWFISPCAGPKSIVARPPKISKGFFNRTLCHRVNLVSEFFVVHSLGMAVQECNISSAII